MESDRVEKEVFAKVLENMSWLLSRRSLTELAPIISGMKSPVKELSEALAVFNHIYAVTKNWGEWTLVDLCSGKFALLSAVTVLNTRRGWAVAVDIERPAPELNLIDRLTYLAGNMHAVETVGHIKRHIRGRVVVAGIHCCKTLALRLIEIADELGAEKGFLVPCCADFPAARRLGLWNGGDKSYQAWVDVLVRYAGRLGFTVKVSFEPMLSEKNALITLLRDGPHG